MLRHVHPPVGGAGGGMTFTPRKPAAAAGTAADLRRGVIRWPLQGRLMEEQAALAAETSPVFCVTSRDDAAFVLLVV